MRKKLNPRRRPATQADVEKARLDAIDDAVEKAWAIIFTVLVDKEGYSQDDLLRIWSEVDDLSDSISSGYCTLPDLKDVLRTEAGAVSHR